MMEKCWLVIFALISIVVLPIVCTSGLMLKIARTVNSDHTQARITTGQTTRG